MGKITLLCIAIMIWKLSNYVYAGPVYQSKPAILGLDSDEAVSAALQTAINYETSLRAKRDPAFAILLAINDRKRKNRNRLHHLQFEDDSTESSSYGDSRESKINDEIGKHLIDSLYRNGELERVDDFNTKKYNNYRNPYNNYNNGDDDTLETRYEELIDVLNRVLEKVHEKKPSGTRITRPGSYPVSPIDVPYVDNSFNPFDADDEQVFAMPPIDIGKELFDEFHPDDSLESDELPEFPPLSESFEVVPTNSDESDEETKKPNRIDKNGKKSEKANENDGVGSKKVNKNESISNRDAESRNDNDLGGRQRASAKENRKTAIDDDTPDRSNDKPKRLGSEKTDRKISADDSTDNLRREQTDSQKLGKNRDVTAESRRESGKQSSATQDRQNTAKKAIQPIVDDSDEFDTPELNKRGSNNRIIPIKDNRPYDDNSPEMSDSDEHDKTIETIREDSKKRNNKQEEIVGSIEDEVESLENYFDNPEFKKKYGMSFIQDQLKWILGLDCDCKEDHTNYDDDMTPAESFLHPKKQKHVEDIDDINDGDSSPESDNRNSKKKSSKSSRNPRQSIESESIEMETNSSEHEKYDEIKLRRIESNSEQKLKSRNERRKSKAKEIDDDLDHSISERKQKSDSLTDEIERYIYDSDRQHEKYEHEHRVKPYSTRNKNKNDQNDNNAEQKPMKSKKNKTKNSKKSNKLEKTKNYFDGNDDSDLDRYTKKSTRKENQTSQKSYKKSYTERNEKSQKSSKTSKKSYKSEIGNDEGFNDATLDIKQPIVPKIKKRDDHLPKDTEDDELRYFRNRSGRYGNSESKHSKRSSTGDRRKGIDLYVQQQQQQLQHRYERQADRRRTYYNSAELQTSGSFGNHNSTNYYQTKELLSALVKHVKMAAKHDEPMDKDGYLKMFKEYKHILDDLIKVDAIEDNSESLIGNTIHLHHPEIHNIKKVLADANINLDDVLNVLRQAVLKSYSPDESSEKIVKSQIPIVVKVLNEDDMKDKSLSFAQLYKILSGKI